MSCQAPDMKASSAPEHPTHCIVVEAASDGAIVQCAAKFWGAECAAAAVPLPMWLWQQRIQSRVEVMCLWNFSLS